MAPASLPLPVFFDYRGQIVENCEFFSGKNDYISIITDRDPSGTYKAVAVRSGNDTREALLASEPCESVQSAIQSLHNKSSEAVHLFIKANGYNEPKYPKVEEDDIDDDDEDTASVVSEQSTSSSTAESTWESSGEEATPASRPSKENRSSSKSDGRRARKSRFPAKISVVRKSKGNDSDDEARPNATILNRQPRYTSLPAGRPPPHPWYRGYAPGMPAHIISAPVAHRQSLPPGSGVPGHSTARFQLPPSQPGVRPMGVPGTVPRVFDVRITIRWLHHSEQRIFESSRASIRALRDTVLIYVRTHMSAFENVTALDHSPNKLWNMRATIKHAFFGSEAYDMSGYKGDDLTKLFTIVGRNDIPRFEVEVDYVRPPPPPVDIVPMNNGAMSA